MSRRRQNDIYACPPRCKLCGGALTADAEALTEMGVCLPCGEEVQRRYMAGETP